jgi:dienelactone hydrolase
MKIFVDKTGKKGPASWEAGTYPDGEEDFPVAGISWYEASAYAAFKGKKLPTVYHWNVIAEISMSMYVVPLSNYNGKSVVKPGTMEGICSFGIYDLAGNVREWCTNWNSAKGEPYILGGGWNDPSYSFVDAVSQSATDRSLSNGFRCIIKLPGDSTIDQLSDPKETPVEDRTFDIFLRQYAYDKTPLNEHVITVADTGIRRVEKVTVDAAYNNERLIIYLFIPKNARPPYQPVIFFPGGGVILENKFTNSNCYPRVFDYIVKSNRVVVYPVFKGTFERKDALKSDQPEETVFYKDHVIMWRKDIGRTIDYLETRHDILADKVGYFGYSWGARLGGLFPAVEKRIKAVVLHVGGLKNIRSFPEVDPFNFLPRVYQPVLMLNGRYDSYFPVETSQKPMIKLLGSPEKDKKLLIYDAGHLVPRADLIKETLKWYDNYLGPVK